MDVKRCHKRRSKGVDTSHAYPPFLFSQIWNYPWADFVIIKKIIVKSRKHPLTFCLFFYFKGIFLVSMCILIVYFFYIFVNTKVPLICHYNSKKNHCENVKISIDTRFKFVLLLKILELFYCIIKIKIYSFVLFGNNNKICKKKKKNFNAIRLCFKFFK